MQTAKEQPATRIVPRRHPMIFTPAEAAAYLGLESERSLETVREEYGLVGHRPAGKSYLYWKSELDRVALKMFGKSEEAGSLKKGGSRA